MDAELELLVNEGLLTQEEAEAIDEVAESEHNFYNQPYCIDTGKYMDDI